MLPLRTLALILSLTLASAAAAELVLDQEQALISASYAPIKIGDFRGDLVGQVFTAGLTGMLKQVELPIGCDSGTLIVEIVNADAWGYRPTATVRARTTVDAKALPMPPAWQTFVFDTPAAVRAGDQLAIVLRNESGTCSVMRGGAGDPYRPGSAWWRPRDVPPENWLSVCEITPGVTCDLPFRTYVDVPPDRTTWCEVTGFGALPFPNYVPVCRCLQDEGLHEQRCTLLHPAFAIIRRIPLIVRPGDPFTIRWTVMPIAPMKELEVLDLFPSGFAGPKSPLKFAAPGQNVTLEYKAVAPWKPGSFHLDSRLVLPGDEAVMESVIQVKP